MQKRPDKENARDVRVLRAPGECEGGDVRSAEALRECIKLADLLLLLLALRRFELLDTVLVERGVGLEARVLRDTVLRWRQTISLTLFNIQKVYWAMSGRERAKEASEKQRKGGERKATHHVFSGKVAARERRPDHRAVAVLLEQRSVFDLELFAVQQAV